jgi:hypothetical protein
VNPRIFYKGNNADDLKSCMNEFKIKKNNWYKGAVMPLFYMTIPNVDF